MNAHTRLSITAALLRLSASRTDENRNMRTYLTTLSFVVFEFLVQSCKKIEKVKLSVGIFPLAKTTQLHNTVSHTFYTFFSLSFSLLWFLLLFLVFLLLLLDHPFFCSRLFFRFTTNATSSSLIFFLLSFSYKKATNNIFAYITVQLWLLDK